MENNYMLEGRIETCDVSEDADNSDMYYCCGLYWPKDETYRYEPRKEVRDELNRNTKQMLKDYCISQVNED